MKLQKQLNTDVLLKVFILQEFKLDRHSPCLEPLDLPCGLSIETALDRVLRLPSVASKRYLTNKVGFINAAVNELF